MKLTEINKLSLPEAVIEYEKQGFALTPILEKSKKAFEYGWNLPTYVRKPESWNENPNLNIGCILSKSNIVAIDVDDNDIFENVIIPALKELLPSNGTFFMDSKTARISSGKPTSRKLVFRVNESIGELEYHKLVWTSKENGVRSGKTIFELRCGLKQDLLPPSIHPEISPVENTNYVYQWIGDEILDIPEDLLYLWKHWNTFDEYLKSLNPNQIKEEPRLKIKYTDNKDDYLNQWLSKQSIHEMLTRYGYVKVGSRYLSPSSHSKSAGIIVSDNKMYSFGESDILCDGHFHDCFDVLCAYEFNGNKSLGLKYVMDELFSSANKEIKDGTLDEIVKNVEKKEESDTEKTEILRESISDWLDEENQEVKIEGFPILKNSPMYDLCLHFAKTSHRPRKLSAFVSALMFGSTICSRGYFFGGVTSKLYSVFIANSGEGKNSLVSAIQNWSKILHAEDLVMKVNRFTSDSSVQRYVNLYPKSIAILDEYGKMLTRQNADSISSSAQTQLMMQYCNNILYPSGYANGDLEESNKNKEVNLKMEVCLEPALSLIGLGNGGDLEENLTEDNFSSGELARFLFFVLPEAVMLPELDEDFEFPERCKTRIYEILQSMGEITPLFTQNDDEETAQKFGIVKDSVILSPYNKPPEKIKCYLEEGELSLRQLDEEYQVKRITEESIIYKTLYSRKLEKVQRIAIIMELMNTPYDKEVNFNAIRNTKKFMISQKSLKDAIMVVDNSDNYMHKFELDKKSFSSQIIKTAKIIYDVLKKGDVESLSRKDVNTILTKMKQPKVSNNSWNLLEDALESIHNIEAIQSPVKKGRPSKRYQLA